MSGSSPIELAADVVAALVSNNRVPAGELPALIHAVHTSVRRLTEGPESAAPKVEAQAPAVSIRKSVTPDFLICLEDGKHFKSMRRHLTLHGMIGVGEKDGTWSGARKDRSGQEGTPAEDNRVGRELPRHRCQGRA